MKVYFSIVLLTASLLSCHSGKTTVQSTPLAMPAPLFIPGPKAIVYKTTRDYFNHVPVQMNAGRTEIVSYPAPSDVFFRGELAYPTRLSDGYLLDNRGIGAYTAFLDYTYEEYSKLQSAPTRAELMEHILDKNPFVEIWNCGLRSSYSEETTELNQLIQSGFKDCRPILQQPVSQEKAK